MRLTEMFTTAQLNAAITDGFIRRQYHPTYPLAILNYTEHAQYKREWNDVTRASRGLIYNTDTLEVVARPFPKFFNHSEDHHPAFNLDEPVTVTDKLDGSLGIVYVWDGRLHVATRGSFTSDQAVTATRILRDRYPYWAPPAGVTALFEIIYPGNRIVLDYGHTEDLILLGGVTIATGETLTPWDVEWPGTGARIFPFNTFAEALAAPPRRNAEGYVVHFRESDVRIKIKQDDYVALHKIVTGWNERTVWEMLASGQDYASLLAGVPDEFHAWAMGVAETLSDQFEANVAGAHALHNALLNTLPESFERRDYAIKAAKYPLNRAALFQLLDGKDITEWAWKQIRPTFTKETINA